MRGKVASEMILLALERITPAYAGKRHVCSAPYKGTGDHPRVCGEERTMWETQNPPVGSPPRMRGRVAAAARRDFLAGITPAYAGKSTRLSRIQHCAEGSPPRMRGRVPTPRPRLIKSQDHPRVCGEEHHPTPSSAAPRGSPPRMRGRGGAQRTTSHYKGITPAYAGKSLSKLRRRVGLRDHPRVCGEEGLVISQADPPQGSPPRMRGRVQRCGYAG